MGKPAAALLLHGMSLNATTFPGLDIPTITPDLDAIPVGSNGITPELRAGGFDVYVRLIENHLKDSESWQDAHRLVVAHSFGGMLALHWVVKHGRSELAKIDGLVLIGTTPGPMYEQVKLLIPGPWRSNPRVGISWIIPTWNLPSTTKLMKRAFCKGKLTAESIDFQRLEIKSEYDLGRAGWRNVEWRALRAYRFTMGGFDVRNRLGEIAVPTIVLHGTEDSLFASDNAHELARLIPNAELRLVKGADHALPITHGGEVKRAVEDLLDG